MNQNPIKKCRQCGDVKPVSAFRPRYTGDGTYSICKDCERINSREKYLRSKSGLTTTEAQELEDIHQLYEYQKAAGLKPPQIRSGTTTQRALANALQKYRDQASQVPTELQQWLTCELTEEPEYYQDTVYEALRASYMPVVGTTPDLLPLYDGTYADILEKILTRFNTYEDTYYTKEDK